MKPGSQISGGTALIQSQARCPRGAFARFRLGAEPPMINDQGLDPMERGSVLHASLEQAWGEIIDSKRLHQMSRLQLSELVDHCVNNASAGYRIRSGCGKAFFRSQHDWLSSTLMEWLDLEKKRLQPFKVIAREQKTDLDLAGLDLHFKVDRIDQLEDGALVLIDYKSGNVGSVGDWARQRITTPQLPLYALAQRARIEVVAFAQVRLGNCCFIGVSNQHTFGENFGGGFRVPALSKHKSLGKAFADWDQMQKFWLQSLTTIAEEFLAGDARVDPDGNGVCRYCETPAFCRSGDHIVEVPDQ